MADESADSTSEQLVDLFVHAPVGIALEAIENFPKFVERGKSQVTLARFFAKMAAQRGTQTVESAAERIVNDAAAVVVDLFGIDLSPDTEPQPTDEAAVDSTIEATSSVAADSTSSLNDLIEGYDDLTAREIISTLADLNPKSLERVREHESAGRARVTILRKIDQLDAA